jgi:hypothetical protein
MPITQVIVWDGPDDRETYDASTPEIFAESCLKLIADMNEEEFYWLEDLVEVEDIDIESLPEPYRTEAADKAKRTVAKNREITQRNAQVTKILEALATHDVSLVTRGRPPHEVVEPAIWASLYARRDYEYESVRLETVR